jgi:hypothetical protein
VISLPVRELGRSGHSFPQAKKRFSVSMVVNEIRRGKALPSDPSDFGGEADSDQGEALWMSSENCFSSFAFRSETAQ